MKKEVVNSIENTLMMLKNEAGISKENLLETSAQSFYNFIASFHSTRDDLRGNALLGCCVALMVLLKERDERLAKENRSTNPPAPFGPHASDGGADWSGEVEGKP